MKHLVGNTSQLLGKEIACVRKMDKVGGMNLKLK